MDISGLRARVASRFREVEQVSDSVLRCIRSLDHLPFAVYYLDVDPNLPDTPGDLVRYQDRVIGTHYFTGRKSLQWNNYLYFVTSSKRLQSDELQRVREFIESDRSYARKFVISEEGLDSFLLPPVVNTSSQDPRTNVLSCWLNSLSEAGLYDLVMSNASMPARLAGIEAATIPPMTMRKPIQSRIDGMVPERIRMLRLEKYREYPLRREFQFGTVNLICGPNASGKTSLLEAIELFYCGRNKRNPDAKTEYRISAELKDGSVDIADHMRKPSVFRERNLEWYGQSEVRTTDLYRSFAQFNFLDTDAAVGLAESRSNSDDELSRLLVGPDASRIWDNMMRLHDALSDHLRAARRGEEQIKDDLMNSRRRLQDAVGVNQESDAIRSRLVSMVQRNGWNWGDQQGVNMERRIIETLSELVPLAQQAANLEWCDSPVRFVGLQAYCESARAVSAEAEDGLARLKQLLREQILLSDSLERCREAKEIALRVREAIDAGVAFRSDERRRLHAAIASDSGKLARLDDDSIAGVLTADESVSVEALHRNALAQRCSAEENLRAARLAYATFSHQRQHSTGLAMQLRQIAAQLLESSETPDECPLCHSGFAPGELRQRIQAGVDLQIESVGQQLLAQTGDCEAALDNAKAIESACALLKAFCATTGLGDGISLGTVLVRIAESRRVLAEANLNLVALDRELGSLAERGFSVDQLDSDTSRLTRLGYAQSERSSAALAAILSRIDQESLSASLAIEAVSDQAKEIRTSLSEALKSPSSELGELEGALARIRSRLVTTESLRIRLEKFFALVPWDHSRAIAEFAVEVDSIRAVAAELQNAVSREESALAMRLDILPKIEKLEARLDESRTKNDRLTQAEQILRKIRTEHSLQSAMESVVKENRSAIELIFAHIHSPSEFSHIGASVSSLVRIRGGKEARLSEISTGQRAAYALSIFLAKNAQLRVGPPVVLIDDPIAHIDDLNALSFLDYLREIALTGSRQIYFATASEKVAALFERKFDCLGDEFCRLDLSRECS